MSCRAGLGQHRPGTLHVALTATGAAALKLSSAAAAAKPVGSPAGVSPILFGVWLAAVTSLFLLQLVCISLFHNDHGMDVRRRSHWHEVQLVI